MQQTWQLKSSRKEDGLVATWKIWAHEPATIWSPMIHRRTCLMNFGVAVVNSYCSTQNISTQDIVAHPRGKVHWLSHSICVIRVPMEKWKLQRGTLCCSLCCLLCLYVVSNFPRVALKWDRFCSLQRHSIYPLLYPFHTVWLLDTFTQSIVLLQCHTLNGPQVMILLHKQKSLSLYKYSFAAAGAGL